MTRIGPYLHAVVLALFLMSLAGCASQQPSSESVLETPELYVSNGFKLIKTGRVDDAEREFTKALKHDPRSSAAYTGLSLAKAYKGDRDAALLSMKRSGSLAAPGVEEYLVQVGWIRLHSVLRDDGWIREAEKAYSWACSTMKDLPDAYYYMGLAYKQGYRIDEARTAFVKVVEIGKSLIPEAQKELGILKKIESAKPLSEIGKRLAVEERVTRAELAALFLHELGITDILRREGPGTSRASATDLQGHPLRGSVEAVLNLKVKGLTVYSDRTFGPDEVVSRAGFSIMMSDIISRAAKDPALLSRYASRGSPFTDVRSDAPYLGAILVCTEWGGYPDAGDDAFNPMGALAGYDAVLSMQKVRGRLLHR
jgi:hypothetical protein